MLELSGQVGKAQIVMELTVQQDGAVDGRYFYRQHHVDIPLAGQRREDGSILLCEGELNDAALGEHGCDGFEIKPAGQGQWQGNWHGPKLAKPLPVQLLPLDISLLDGKRPAPVRTASGSSGRYELARRADMSFKRGRTERIQGHALQWWDEPVSGVSLFRVLDGYPADALTRINQVLTERHWQEVGAALSCLVRQGQRGDYEVQAKPRLLSPKLFSASVMVSYDCGGAHPDFGDAPINLDVESGRSLLLEDLLWLGRGKPYLARNANGDRSNFDYEDNLLAPWISKTMAQRYPRQVKPQRGDECDYRDKAVWRFPSWYLTPKGLYLGPSFPRALRACEYPDWAVLPWSVLRQHPGAGFSRLP
ncbi:DUF3298 domain-containing protein [Chitinimonas naiadis]